MSTAVMINQLDLIALDNKADSKTSITASKSVLNSHPKCIDRSARNTLKGGGTTIGI